MGGNDTLKQARGKVRPFLVVTPGIKNGCFMGFASCEIAVFA